MHFIFPKRTLFEVFTSKLPVFTTSRTIAKHATDKDAKKIKMCGIMNLNVHKEILKSDLDTGYLNKSVKVVLSKNILVPEVSLFCDFSKIRRGFQHTDFSRKIYTNKLPTDMKIGKFSPKEKFLIQENSQTLLVELKATKNKEEVFIDMFMKDEDQYFSEKVHILGLYLSQGMKDIRLPCDVFLTARNLHLSNKDQFTKEEDEMILNYMNNEGLNSKTPYADISKKLERSIKSVESRHKDILIHQDKTKLNLRFSNYENEQIMKAVFEYYGFNLKEIDITNRHNIWEQLGEKLCRRPNNIYNHWYQFMLPHLIHHENGVLYIDIREPLIDYCVDNNIMFAQEANWQEIVTNPRFAGTTASNLSSTYRNVRQLTKRKIKKNIAGVEDHEITSKTMQKYLLERTPSPRKRKDVEELISSYELLKEQQVVNKVNMNYETY